MNEKALDPTFKYSADDWYFCPDEMDLKGYKQFINDSFPLYDPPEVFGLHVNANITVGQKQTY